MVSKCNSRCDICQKFLACKNEFKCKVTGKTYKVRGNLDCNSLNVVYLINCKLCGDQYVGSALKNNFKPRFRVHKSDIVTGKDRKKTNNKKKEKRMLCIIYFCNMRNNGRGSFV